MNVNRLAGIAKVFVDEGLGYLTGAESLKAVASDASPREATDVVAPSTDREKARRLRRIFERLGPTFVKFGQMLANRIDLFSDEFIGELSQLHAKVPPFANDVARRMIETELGQSIDQVFSEFSADPVASASIAQVYRARLRSSGDEVAVKVQRPDLDKSLIEDLDLIIQMSAWLDALVPAYRKSMMHVVAKEYAQASRMELDFLSEAAAIQEFSDTYAEDDYFAFTRVHTELSTARLIVMEWFEGPRLGQIADAAELAALGFDRQELVQNLFRIQLTMAYENGMIHADMHPGNIILRKDGRLGIIDCGLFARVPKKTREAVLKMLLYQAQGRVAEQVDIALQIAGPADAKDLPKFRQDMIELFSRPQPKSASSVSSSIVASMRVGTKYKSQANPYLLMIVRNLVIIEGIFLKFAPEFDPTAEIGKNVKAILMRRLSPEAVMDNVSPVLGELAIALHGRPELLSRLLRLETKFVEAPTIGDFMRSENMLAATRTPVPQWLLVCLGLTMGIGLSALWVASR